MKRNRLVKQQKEKVIHSSETYWDKLAKDFVEDETRESPLANPDILSEDCGIYYEPESFVDEALVEAIKNYAKKKLTERERLVIFLLAEGQTIPEVAKFLCTTTKTVHTFLFRARTKLKSFVIKYRS